MLHTSFPGCCAAPRACAHCDTAASPSKAARTRLHTGTLPNMASAPHVTPSSPMAVPLNSGSVSDVSWPPVSGKKASGWGALALASAGKTPKVAPTGRAAQKPVPARGSAAALVCRRRRDGAQNNAK
jgi:hypothetical protein